MLLRPRSNRPTKTPFIATVVVIAAVIATLGLTQGNLVATALATPFSQTTADEAPAPHLESCERERHPVQQVVYVAPGKDVTQAMEHVILAQIAAVRKHDPATVWSYIVDRSGTSFADAPTTNLQRVALLSTSDKLTFGPVKIGPCHHDGYLTVTGFVKGKPTYIAQYVVVTDDVVHPKWGISSVDVTLAMPPSPAVAAVHPSIPEMAKS